RGATRSSRMPLRPTPIRRATPSDATKKWHRPRRARRRDRACAGLRSDRAARRGALDHARARSRRSSMLRSSRGPAAARTSCSIRARLLLLALKHHQVKLVELGLAEREEHLDEQTIRGARVGDHDRLRARGIFAGRETNLTIDLTPRLERLTDLRDVEIVRAVSLVLAFDAVRRIAGHFDAGRFVVDHDLRL